jgi:hypothetical protein
MTTFQTYEQVGKKEDISDVISNISPTKTPFQTAIGNEKVTNTLFQWQEDALRNVAVNAQIEGADPTDITVSPTAMRSNYTQIFTESVKVSGTADKVAVYGRAREMSYQLAKSSAALKRDVENAFVGTAQTHVVGDDSTARKMDGVQAMIDNSNVVSIASANLDEAHLLTCLQDVYTNGADPSRIQVTPSNSLIVAGFAAASGRYRTFQNGTAGDKSIVNVVNLYVSPFGEQKVELNRFLATHHTLVFDPNMWAKCTLRPWTKEMLAKTGDAERNMIVGEFSLKHKNFKASGLIKDNQ